MAMKLLTQNQGNITDEGKTKQDTLLAHINEVLASNQLNFNMVITSSPGLGSTYTKGNGND
jgi:hypothetical protein